MSNFYPLYYESLALETYPLDYELSRQCDHCHKYYEGAAVQGDTGDFCSEACKDDDQHADIFLTDEEDI